MINTLSQGALYRGNDWSTDRHTLAQALATLDDLHALSLGFAPDNHEGPLDQSETLRVMADLAQGALTELDFVAADQMPHLLESPQASWSAFEARQLLIDLVMLCVEARDAFRCGRPYKSEDGYEAEMPRALSFELGYLTGRVKELLKAIDNAA